MARLRPAAEARWHQRHPGVVDHRPGRRESARSGLILASRLTLSAHVIALRRAGYYQLWQLHLLVLSDVARTVTAAFISCRLDYCNSLLYGLPDPLVRKLQCGQNATARLITGTRRCDHTTPVLRELHWLHIRERVKELKFKVACPVLQSLSIQASSYLEEDCCLVSDSTRRSLRSTNVPTCVVPQTLISYGYRFFAAAGPRLWNSLPVRLRYLDITYGLFIRQLRGHFYRKAWTRRLICSALEKHLHTYLHSISWI